MEDRARSKQSRNQRSQGLFLLERLANGLAYILAVVGVNRFEKKVDRLGRIINIDEQ